MKQRIAASFTALFWGALTYIGYSLTNGVAQRHVPGYPSAGQWQYYVYFPLAMLTVSVVLLLLARRVPATLFVAVWILQLLVVFPFLFWYGGGV